MSHFSMTLVCSVHLDAALETGDNRIMFCPACGHGDNLADEFGAIAHDGTRYRTITVEELRRQDWGAHDDLRKRLLGLAAEREP